MTDNSAAKCDKCGSRNLESGQFVGFLSVTRFRSDGLFTLSKEVAAVACLNCGHIELKLTALTPEEAPVASTLTIDEILRRR
jgi:predicted nucleic-acid-binding Zn-ribbon protein